MFDVLAHKEELLPKLKTILQYYIDTEYQSQNLKQGEIIRRLRLRGSLYLDKFWGRKEPYSSDDIKARDLSKEMPPIVSDRRLDGVNVLTNDNNVEIRDCVIYAYNVLSHADRAKIFDSLIVAHDILNGVFASNVNNSVLFAWNVLGDAKSGEIRDSIICGHYNVLDEDSGVDVHNSVIITS